MKEDVSGLAGKRKALAATAFSQLPALGAPGKVVSRTAIAGLDMEQVTFANGARLLLFPNDAAANRVYVNVRFGGGYNAQIGRGSVRERVGQYVEISVGAVTLKK